MGMKPPHPGKHLKYDWMKALGLTVTETAKGLGVSRNHLSQITNGKAGISSEMAVKLSEAFGTTPEIWIRLQTSYDLWHAKRKVKRKGIRNFVSHSEKREFAV